MFKRRKDGALNLSIQAIVILVMAMAVLGLGLSFIRGLIGKGEEQFGRAIDNAALENPADAQNPVTVDRTVRVKAVGNTNMKVGFYNSGASGSFTPEIDSNCDSYFDLAAASQDVPTGEARGYEALISYTGGLTAPASEICTISFGGSTPTKQFVVELI